MRAVVTRVKSASVTIDGNVNGSIGKGFLRYGSIFTKLFQIGQHCYTPCM